MAAGDGSYTGTRLNVGCGQSPVPGWYNYDNSITVRLARLPDWLLSIIAFMLRLAGMGGAVNWEFMAACRAKDIRYAQASRLPHADGSVDAIYSCHMFEHLDAVDASAFLAECRRVLKRDGVLRLVVPDTGFEASNVTLKGLPWHVFVARLDAYTERQRGLREKIKFMIVGFRGHYAWYNPEALANTVRAKGFSDVRLLEFGETTIPEPGQLDLAERGVGNIWLEARQ